MSFRPATDNGNYMSVWDSHILDENNWSLGTTIDYSYRPLQLTTDGKRETGILDNIIEQHFYSSVGIIKDRLEIGLDVPIGWWLNYRDSNRTALGDTILNAKIGITNIQGTGIGLSILPFISIPTGKSEYFFGNGVVSTGLTLITEINPIKNLFVALNLGLLAKKNYTLRNIDDASKLTGGIGINFFATENLNITGDFLFKARLSGIFKEEAETPIEFIAGTKYHIPDTNLIINGGIGGGLINGAGAPSYRILMGLTYNLSSCSSNKDKDKSTSIKTPFVPTSTLVHFDFNSITIKDKKELEKLDEIAEVQDMDIKIEGNTDNIGSDHINYRISKQRAEAVAKYLNKQGVTISSMVIVGNGNKKPVADNNTKEGRKKNRRVEVKVQEKTK